MKSVLALVLAAGAAFSAQVPRQAPELAIRMPDGSQKLLSSYRGKTVVVAFVFTTCPHCQRMMGTLSGIQKEYAAKGVQVLASAFNLDSDKLAGSFAATYVNGFPAGSNQKLTVLEFLQQPDDPQHPYFVPILVFIDRKGVIRQQIVGEEKYLQDPETNVRASIDALLKEPASKTPVRKKTAITSSTK
ncbi:MAG: Redoxin domain protein [Bryobacterales bacterium]|nr:Redoxin domain protein [Bryobacterales bacterium]